MDKANISRNVEMTGTLVVSSEDFMKVDDTEQLFDAVIKAVEKSFQDNQSKDGTGLSEVKIDIEFDGYKTLDHKELNADDVKAMSEDELDGVVAEITVNAEAVDNGIEHEGYQSHDYYEPDEPAYVEGLDDEEVSDEIMSSVEKAFEQFGVEVSDYEVDEFSAPEWEDVMEANAESALMEAEEARYEMYHEGFYGD